MQRFAVLALFSIAALACESKKDPPGSVEAKSADSASAAPTIASAAAPAASATAKPAGPAAASFAGKYESKASSLYLPDTKEMKNVKWRGDESSEGLGAGELNISIAADGTVSGEASGPLGAMVVNGHADGDHVAATLTRKSEDGGFTGTLLGDRKGDALSGEMNLTRHDASVLRVATFQLAAK